MSATKAATKGSSKEVEISSLLDSTGKINTQLSLEGKKLVNNTGKKEFTPYSIVELPAGEHYAVFTGNVLVRENKNGEIMYFVFFTVDDYGTVLTAQKLEDVNNFVKGVKYILQCGDPKGGYSTIRKIVKA